MQKVKDFKVIKTIINQFNFMRSTRVSYINKIDADVTRLIIIASQLFPRRINKI